MTWDKADFEGHRAITAKQAKIKRARLQDIESVYAFIIVLEQEDFDKTAFKRIYRKNIRNKDNIYLLAWHNEPVGYLSCHIQTLLHHCGPVAEIQEMYVPVEKRGQGIGKALLDQLKSILKKRNVRRIEVTSNVNRRQAHKFYLGENFRITSKKFVCEDY